MKTFKQLTETTIPNLVVPLVHTNGTHKDSLIEERTKVLGFIRDAEKALAEMAPNGRDYYHTGNFAAAKAQHSRRQQILDSLRQEIEQETEAIADQ